MKRYRVEFKAFKTGQWYTKTETDSIAAAFSVAKIGNYLRACRLTDTETGRILYESEEDPEMKKTNGYKIIMQKHYQDMVQEEKK